MDYQKSIKLVPPLGQLYLAGVLSLMGWLKSLPLVGKSPHHIQSTSNFVSNVREVTLLLGECLSSYDVTSLFTSVPVDPALNIIKDLLEQDETLSDRTVLSVQHFIELLGLCLHNAYFSFQNRFYKQVKGVAMGSLVSPIVANLCMGAF